MSFQISPPRRKDHLQVRKTLKPVNFICVAPHAKCVTLVADFNGWQPGTLPLKRRVDGAWSIQVPLGHGHYQYRFLVDGQPVLDPRAQGIVRDENNEKAWLLSVS